ncbi:hypothetical protein KAM338_40370 [Aeromonas caviae]|nr:hypothetical protein KAM338_40370 [Aeromonas caviae]
MGADICVGRCGIYSKIWREIGAHRFRLIITTAIGQKWVTKAEDAATKIQLENMKVDDAQRG